MKVFRTRSIEVEGLGQAIKEARLRDQRPLTKICLLVDMTTANWYRIEAEKNESLPEDTLRKIEAILGVDFGVQFEDN
ncbi:MAG: transcriptional regulator [Acaryochloridaceae cyanobacterium RL_2_7]|nr:transcriptional regulator [Acaryochloridaceae cyanobacterium RL_2_7]